MKNKISAGIMALILTISLMCGTFAVSAESTTIDPSDLTYVDPVPTTTAVDYGEVAESIISEHFSDEIEEIKDPLNEKYNFFETLLENIRGIFKMIQDFVYQLADTIKGVNIFG